jgi:hypothetical protein
MLRKLGYFENKCQILTQKLVPLDLPQPRTKNKEQEYHTNRHPSGYWTALRLVRLIGATGAAASVNTHQKAAKLFLSSLCTKDT